MSLLAHQQRVVDEQVELANKCSKLRIFIDSSAIYNSLDVTEKSRLRRQLSVMLEYEAILKDRIDNF